MQCLDRFGASGNGEAPSVNICALIYRRVCVRMDCVATDLTNIRPALTYIITIILSRVLFFHLHLSLAQSDRA
jgi:hypothetical protein